MERPLLRQGWDGAGVEGKFIAWGEGQAIIKARLHLPWKTLSNAFIAHTDIIANKPTGYFDFRVVSTTYYSQNISQTLLVTIKLTLSDSHSFLFETKNLIKGYVFLAALAALYLTPVTCPELQAEVGQRIGRQACSSQILCLSNSTKKYWDSIAV